MSKIHVITVAYERYEPLEILIRSFLVQTNPNWILYIVYDGPAPQGILDIVAPFVSGSRKDERIRFFESPERNQKYGHPNRRSMLQAIEADKNDYILMQNDDNYMVPRTVEFIIKEMKHDTGIIYWDTVHSHMDYNVHISQLKENFIDMAAFAVRADIAKSTGFNHDHFSADGTYAEECLNTCKSEGFKAVKINKPLLIHN
jgi:GT2 family glycosyltransferase